MTVEILNFTEALRLTDTGKRIIKKKQYDRAGIQVLLNAGAGLYAFFESILKKEKNGM